MFGFHTPKQNIPPRVSRSPNSGSPDKQKGNVATLRRSFGEEEETQAKTAANSQKATTQRGEKVEPKQTGMAPTKNADSQKDKGATLKTLFSQKQPSSYKNRVSEAKACLQKAKTHLGNSRNLKSEIKQEVTEAVDRLFELVKEAEAQNQIIVIDSDKNKKKVSDEELREPTKEHSKFHWQIEEHSKLLKENREEMLKLTEMLKKQGEIHERYTYANIVAGSPKTRVENTTMHSLVVTSSDEQETGEEVFNKIKKVINAKEEGVCIDRIRKAKDRKIIIGCKNQEEIRKVGEKLKKKDVNLNVEEIKNKDPLIILYGVLQSNTDEDIIQAIQNQNKHLLKQICAEESRIEIRFRRRARNPLVSYVVARVSPRIWQALTNAGAVHIDMQRVRVADQSPLIQCSRCLGYGHSKRFCTATIDVCSHCGGPHLKTECADWMAGAPPSCINCTKAKIGKVEHGAFSNECPVRRKWETLARSTVAYC